MTQPSRAENFFYAIAFTAITLATIGYCIQAESYMHGAIDQHNYEVKQSNSFLNEYTLNIGRASKKDLLAMAEHDEDDDNRK